MLAGRFYIDGRDAWLTYNVVLEKGVEDFLKYPAAKERITHDWSDSNGVDVDTSIVTFKSRDITLGLSMWIQDGKEETFFKNHEGFIALMAKPKPRRIEIADLGMRSYHCIYKETPTATKHTLIVGQQQRGDQIFFSFTLRLTEIEPQIVDTHVFLVNEDNQFIIT